MVIQVIDRAVRMLDLAQKVGGPVSSARLSEAAGVQQSTGANIIKSLLELGCFEAAGRGYYKIGPRILGWSKPQDDHANFLDNCAKALEKITGALNEVSVLASRSGPFRQNQLIEKADREVLIHVDHGKALDLNITATGRIFLAYMDSEERKEYLAQYPITPEQWPEMFTGKKCEKKLAEQWEKIREEGHVILRSHPDILGFARPITFPDGSLHALGVFAPRYRTSPEREDQILRVMEEECGLLSEQIKW